MVLPFLFGIHLFLSISNQPISISFVCVFRFEDGVVEVWDDEEDDWTFQVVKCRWRKCGAVLQSKAHCLEHVQVVHIGKAVVGSFVFERRFVMPNSIHIDRPS
jgi:hypothetical protein